MNEYDILEECAELLREVQNKLNSLPSKNEKWNKNIRKDLDRLCSIITI